jgi:hypothetical protein
VRDREVCTQHIASHEGAAVFDSNRCQPADLITAQPAATEALREKGPVDCYTVHLFTCFVSAHALFIHEQAPVP